jgi:hypothetical protein
MDIGLAGFEACGHAPSPAPKLYSTSLFAVPTQTQIGIAQHTQFPPTLSLESLGSGSHYSMVPFSTESRMVCTAA